MVKIRTDHSGAHAHYGVSRAQRMAARWREKGRRQRRLRRIEKASRQFNLMRAKGKR